jgi:hypothetical protein
VTSRRPARRARVAPKRASCVPVATLVRRFSAPLSGFSNRAQRRRNPHRYAGFRLVGAGCPRQESNLRTRFRKALAWRSDLSHLQEVRVTSALARQSARQSLEPRRSSRLATVYVRSAPLSVASLVRELWCARRRFVSRTRRRVRLAHARRPRDRAGAARRTVRRGPVQAARGAVLDRY